MRVVKMFEVLAGVSASAGIGLANRFFEAPTTVLVQELQMSNASRS